MTLVIPPEILAIVQARTETLVLADAAIAELAKPLRALFGRVDQVATQTIERFGLQHITGGHSADYQDR